MEKYQYMVITVGAIFCVLLLIGFGVLVNLTFKEKKMAKKMAPCPDYWTEEKDVLVVDVNPNKDFIYKDDSPFAKYRGGVYTAMENVTQNGEVFTKDVLIGNNAIQQDIIMFNANTPLLRINNEVTKKITACKVPVSGNINVGNIYNNSGIQIRNSSYGPTHNNLRNNYTTPDKIDPSGILVNVSYKKAGSDKKNKIQKYIYELTTPTGNIITTGDPSVNVVNELSTPGFYWKANCISDDPVCLSGKDDSKVKIWGNNYSNDGGIYNPTEFYIDFKDNAWHALNMHKSTKCNIKGWAIKNNIVWDGITNMDC
jgi:hypothetical protein